MKRKVRYFCKRCGVSEPELHKIPCRYPNPTHDEPYGVEHMGAAARKGEAMSNYSWKDTLACICLLLTVVLGLASIVVIGWVCLKLFLFHTF